MSERLGGNIGCLPYAVVDKQKQKQKRYDTRVLELLLLLLFLAFSVLVANPRKIICKEANLARALLSPITYHTWYWYPFSNTVGLG